MENKNVSDIPARGNALIIYKKSAYELMLEAATTPIPSEQFNTLEMLVKVGSHERQKAALATVHKTLLKQGFIVNSVYRADTKPHDITWADLIVPCGGDGTVLEASHFIKDKPVLAINLDPQTSVGAWCATDAQGLERLFEQPSEFFMYKAPRMQADVNGHLLPESGLNNIKVRHPTDGTMRYTMTIDGITFSGNKDSGVMISTAKGGPGWMTKAGGVPMHKYDPRFQIKNIETDLDVGGFGEDVSIVNRLREAYVVIDTEYVVHKLKQDDVLRIRHGAPLHIYLRNGSRPVQHLKEIPTHDTSRDCRKYALAKTD